MYILNMNPAFAIFLRPGTTWTQRVCDPQDTRGFANDTIADNAEDAVAGAMMPDPNGYTAIQKVAKLKNARYA